MRIRKSFLLVSLLFTMFVPFMSFSQERQRYGVSPDLPSQSSQWKKGVELNGFGFKWVILEHRYYSFFCYAEIPFSSEDISQPESEAPQRSAATIQIAMSFEGKFLSCYPYRHGERALTGGILGVASDFFMASPSLEIKSVACGAWSSIIRLRDSVERNSSSQGYKISFDFDLLKEGELLMDREPRPFAMSGNPQRGMGGLIGEKPWHPLPPLPLPLMDAGEFLDLKEPAFCVVTE